MNHPPLPTLPPPGGRSFPFLPPPRERVGAPPSPPPPPPSSSPPPRGGGGGWGGGGGSRAETPKFSGTPPIRKPGLSPAYSRIHASIAAVVVLPCVPATASTPLPRR